MKYIFMTSMTRSRWLSIWRGLSGVRKVNYSNSAAAGLSSFNKVLALLFGAII